MNKELLKQQIAQIEGQKDQNTSTVLLKFLRDLKYFESQLRLSKVELPFYLPLADIVENESSQPIGVHGHTRREYTLHWEKDGALFSFTLENIKAKKKKKLMVCPEEILKDMMPLIPIFIEKMAKNAEAQLAEAVASGAIELEEDHGNDEELEELEE